MKNIEKAEIIDKFLKGLIDANFPSSLANIIELKQYPSKENEEKFKLLEYELEKHDLVELISGRDNSTINGQCEYIISGKGFDYVSGGKSTLELFESNEIKSEDDYPKTILDDLTDRAESYLSLTLVEPMKSKVNSRENINFFLNWFYESRNIFRDFVGENDLDFKEFQSHDLSGNGNSLASIFSRIYPLFNVLKRKILNSKTLIDKQSPRKMTNKGFIIHGHNNEIKLEVARFIENRMKKKAIILHEQASRSKSVMEKLIFHSDVDFAIAIWTADDHGKALKNDEFKYRARQNVIFETGLFIGKLGTDRVIILYEEKVEIPTDLSGIIYIPLNGNWLYNLQIEIQSIYE